ncbi:ABC transporter ATP-binding protein [Arenibaculum pallidiluteum]|uniref:ABC transporter ATP-binding protein n=1 Tax=Arenibaculum pallidiluteum TaxID=2812559 RepID=UPI001A9770B2|nr:ABC transporter ATP-binding protein [Arenibaculum pallidiluteum]
MSEPVIEIHGLRYAYGKRAVLHGVDLTVARGEFAVLLGPNGAGKTTLMALMTGLFNARDGRIMLEGSDIRRDPTRVLGRLGVVFQQPTLDLDLTVRQNLRYFAALQGLTPRRAEERAAEELERHGLAERLGDRVRDLSGGQRRRVELARALLHEPTMLILDEPTVGLDLRSRRAIVEHCHDLARDRGLTVLWATHLIDEVWPTDTVAVLHQGRIVARGGVDAIKDSMGSSSLVEAFEHLTRTAA